jgi:hypothetical protein
MIGLRRLALASAALILTFGAAPALGQTSGAVLAAAAKKAPDWPGLPPGAVEEVMTLRDGTKLAANVFKPAGKGPWPVVLSRTP